jgi:hypothetical protein
MNIFILLKVILPVIGFASVLIMYSLIIAKRYQKKLLIDEDYEKTGREPNVYKITDVSERLWWNLAITIVFISYFGFIIAYVNQKKDVSALPDAILIGFFVWAVIAFVGWKITRK